MTREETVKINTQVLQNAHTKSETLCWLCKCACDSATCYCNKSRYDKPVIGWEVTEHTGELGREYNVRKCPEFKFEWDRPQELADIMPILVYWLKTDNVKEYSVRRKIYRNPEGAVATYNAMHPELPLILYTEADIITNDDELDLD